MLARTPCGRILHVGPSQKLLQVDATLTRIASDAHVSSLGS